MSFTQASTSPQTIFLPPDPPESAPPGAGPPDRGSPFAGLLEGHTNARTAPAEGVKKKGPPASAAAPAEGSAAPKSEGANVESASATGQAGTPVAGSAAEAAAQSESTPTPIGGEASVAAGAAVAVGAATAAPLTLAEPAVTTAGTSQASTPAAATAPTVPQGEAILPNTEAAPTDPTATPLPATGEPTSSATPAPTATAPAGAGQIELPASAEAVTGEEVAPKVTPPAPEAQVKAPEPQVQTAPAVESKVEPQTRSGVDSGVSKDQGKSSAGRPPAESPVVATPAEPEAPISHETAPPTTDPAPAPVVAPTQAPANSPTPKPSFASPAGPAPSPAAALEATIRVAGENGYTRARVALHPAELGGVEVLLRGGGSGLTATVVAENPHAAHLLEQSAGELQRRLADQGLELASLHVLTVGGEAAGTAPDGRPGAQAPAGRAATVNTDDGADAPAAPDLVQTIDLGGGVLVDVLA